MKRDDLTKAVAQGAACGLVFGIVVLTCGRILQPAPAGAQSPMAEVVKARRFEVIDAGGTLRGILDDKGLRLLGATLNTRASLRHEGLTFVDETGKIWTAFNNEQVRISDAAGRTRIAIDPDGFWVADATGRTRARLYVVANGQPRLSLIDAERHTRAFLTLGKTGDPSLGLADAGGHTRALLTTLGETGDPTLSFGVDQRLETMLSNDGLVLYHSDRPRAILNVSANGQPSLVLRDETGVPRAVLGGAPLESTQTREVTRRPESSLVLFDKDGKVIWKAP